MKVLLDNSVSLDLNGHTLVFRQPKSTFIHRLSLGVFREK